MSRGLRANRAGQLVKLYDAGERDVIRFITTGGDVHILAVAGTVPKRHAELFGTGETETMMRFMLGECWAVCGTRFVRHRSGFESGAQLVSHFPDERLCPRCHVAFGDRGEVIFEVNQDDGSDPTQVGQLTSDIIGGARPLQ